MNFKFENGQKGVVIGGSSGIAQAVGQYLNERYPDLQLISVSRQGSQEVDFHSQKHCFNYLSESDWQTFASSLGQTKIDFILNFVGTLNGNDHLPEKNLKAINFENLSHCFEVNIKPLILGIQTLQPFLRRDELTLISSLSAKIGSITDNDLGGWYSYRMAKSSLNMFLKTLSREYYFKYPKCIINSIHPGTTRTRFTASYLSSIKHKVHDPLNTAQNLITVWESLNINNSGEFRNWDGAVLPW